MDGNKKKEILRNGVQYKISVGCYLLSKKLPLGKLLTILFASCIMDVLPQWQGMRMNINIGLVFKYSFVTTAIGGVSRLFKYDWEVYETLTKIKNISFYLEIFRK